MSALVVKKALSFDIVCLKRVNAVLYAAQTL